MSQEPVRTCISCRMVRPKSELDRYVWRAASVLADPRQILSGRGAYHCRNEVCREGFFTNDKRLKRAFRLN